MIIGVYMSLCDTCIIEEKLYQCCGRQPMTGAVKVLTLVDGRKFNACPNLGSDGMCTIYAGRPNGCREFFCQGYKENEQMERGLYPRSM